MNPSNSYLGMDIQKHDNEGRLITLEYPEFFLVNVYTPNAQRGLTRLDYRTKEWDVDFLNYLKKINLDIMKKKKSSQIQQKILLIILDLLKLLLIYQLIFLIA